jgi:hypothetical protein
MTEPRRPLPLIVGRAVFAGALAGGVTGLVVGTATFPIVGTCLGSVAGVAAGAGIGLVDGAALAVLSRRTSSRLVFAIAAGLICGIGAVAGAVVAFGGWQRVPASGWEPPAFMAWCAALGLVLGPVVVRGRGRRGRGLTRIGHFAAYGAGGAAVVGSVTGLAVGLVTYAPTAAFALIEGCLLAGPPGAVIGALAAFAPIRRAADAP